MQPCFCMILRNFKRTLEEGRIRTCFFPFLSALTMVLKQSARILALVICVGLWLKQFNIYRFIQSKFNSSFIINFESLTFNLDFQKPIQSEGKRLSQLQKIMFVPKHSHSGIHLRNFLTLFVCLSFMTYIHLQLNQATSILKDTNSIVSAILNNETYTITQERLFNLDQSLKYKSYHELQQAECLTKIYLDVVNNQKFKTESKQRQDSQNKEKNQKIFIIFNFTQLLFPTTHHDLQLFQNCTDILTLINFLNPTKTDFIYTKFIQSKYGSFIKNQQQHQLATNQTKFCIIAHQFDTSTTTLRKSIKSIIGQTYQNYRLVIIDNGSTDGSYEIAKVILEDFKEKIIKKNQNYKKTIQQKYQIIKQESRMGLWKLYKKHDGICQETDFVIFVDGRDSFSSRHVLSILNHQIKTQKDKPDLITAPLLKKKELSRQNPVIITQLNKISTMPTFSFKVVSIQMIESTKQKLFKLSEEIHHPFEVEKMSLQVFYDFCLENNKKTLQVNEMLYVYDTIENKEIDRNEYYISAVKKKLDKKNKEKKDQTKKQS